MKQKYPRSEEQLVTFHPNMAVRFLLPGLEVRRRLQIVDADDGRGGLVVYHPGPVLLGADLRALPVNVVDRGAAPYLQLPAGEVLVRNEELKADLGDLPLRFVRVQGAVRADVGLQRLHRRERITRDASVKGRLTCISSASVIPLTTSHTCPRSAIHSGSPAYFGSYGTDVSLRGRHR